MNICRQNNLQNHACFVAVFFALLSWAATCNATDPTAQQIEFFESQIRPVLVERCYRCHNSSGTAEGDLALDFRDGLLQGGFSGPAVVPSKPQDSLLLQAILHSDELRMPKDDPRLNQTSIAAFRRWIEMGAPDPRDQPPNKKTLQQLTSWNAIRTTRMKLWSFQPPQPVEMPPATVWSDKPIDRLILQQLQKQHLQPAPPADKPTIARRLSFALTGLPPAATLLQQFLNDKSEDAYSRLVDQLLNSPQYGERWARHWMDVFRYAESHGSEGDPGIPHAYRYRNYLIRALNDDVSYTQMVREHIAGDLLSDPRINPTQKINESALATGHYRFVPHGYAPVDAKVEQIAFIDNQVDVISKAFLGLTVSCARCHDHKFDAISQRDYYRFYGILANARPALITVDTPIRADTNKQQLTQLKKSIRHEIAQHWLKVLQDSSTSLMTRWLEQIKLAGKKDAIVDQNPLFELATLNDLSGEQFTGQWDKIKSQWTSARDKNQTFQQQTFQRRWILSSGDDHQQWTQHGTGLAGTSRGGDFAINPTGDQIIENIHVAGLFTNSLSSRHNGVLHSPEFNVDFDDIWIQVAGLKSMGSRLRFVMENYPRVIGLLYLEQNPNSINPAWIKFDMRYFRGNSMYLELATAYDLPVEARSQQRSWFGLTNVACLKAGQIPPVNLPNRLAAVTDQTPTNPQELGKLYQVVLRRIIAQWQRESISDEEARFLGFFVRNQLLPNQLSQLPSIGRLLTQYRHLENIIPTPVRSPGVIDRHGVDHPLWTRGNPNDVAAMVPRGFLEAFSDRQYTTTQSGRLELAEDLSNPDNPLVGRVIANRIWHHLFGRGIVSTVDNFGHLGTRPTHPELLNYLVSQLDENNWSQKNLIRQIVMSATYRQASHNPSVPDNQRATALNMFAQFPITRLDGEAIRDAMLVTAATLDPTMYQTSVAGTSPRRSLYVRTHRNNPDPFLNIFDRPEPLSTVGARGKTNVPAQSLTLLNSAFVINTAKQFAADIIKDTSLVDNTARFHAMFLRAFSRAPTAIELEQCHQYFEQLLLEQRESRDKRDILNKAIRSQTQQIHDILHPVRQTLLQQKAAGKLPTVAIPSPIHHWDFENSLQDQIGDSHAIASNNAHIQNGALILNDAAAYAITKPISKNITEKTLAAIVQLTTLNQRAGGVITIQTNDGIYFDSIVYAEKDSQQWLAGSNNFSRTAGVNGPPETSAVKTPVHIAITYAKDGTIHIFRNGKPYGDPYKSSGPAEFKANESVICFGIRHTPVGGNRMLAGRILDAQIYNQALNADEILALASGSSDFIPEKLVMAALTIQQQQRIAKLQTSLTSNHEVLDSLGPNIPPQEFETRTWQDFAQSLFNFKEFIFIR